MCFVAFRALPWAEALLGVPGASALLGGPPPKAAGWVGGVGWVGLGGVGGVVGVGYRNQHVAVLHE